MEPNKRYLIHCCDGHTFCGVCVAQVGPHTYRFERVSKIRNTGGGDVWHEIAAGTYDRTKCDYTHYTTPAILPLSIAAFEWVGNLPQEM